MLATPSDGEREALATAYRSRPAVRRDDNRCRPDRCDPDQSPSHQDRRSCPRRNGPRHPTGALDVRWRHGFLPRFVTPAGRRRSDSALFAFNALLAAAADVFADACLDGILSATGRGSWKSYADLAPSAVG